MVVVSLVTHAAPRVYALHVEVPFVSLNPSLLVKCKAFEPFGLLCSCCRLLAACHHSNSCVHRNALVQGNMAQVPIPIKGRIAGVVSEQQPDIGQANVGRRWSDLRWP